MGNDCLFCKIVSSDIPSNKVYEDEFVIGFQDIAPQAKIHLLFIHKKHTKNMMEMVDENPEQMLQIFRAISSYSRNNSMAEIGFRLVSNIGESAGQSVFHTHIHLLAGEPLGRFGT